MELIFLIYIDKSIAYVIVTKQVSRLFLINTLFSKKEVHLILNENKILKV